MNAAAPRNSFSKAPALSTALLSGADAVATSARMGSRMLAGSSRLGRIRDEDVDIATTPKDLVWSQDKVTLHRYRPLVPARARIPLLVTYGLIGRWTMTDLQDDRSLVRNLLNLGVELYVVDWGNPSRADRYLTMDDYICGYLDQCVEAVARLSGVAKINLFGLCEGGVFTTCYAALEPERVNAMALAITPIDFHADIARNRLGFGLINVWTRSLPREDVDRLIDAHGNVPGKFFGAMFNQLTPMRTALKYNFDMLDVIDDEHRLLNWLRMEKWIADRPDHPGEAARQWMIELYQQNKLVRNELELDGRRVDLKRIIMPVLNVFGNEDHIIPAETSQALGREVGTDDYEELALPGGHVGIFVGGRSQRLFAPALADFVLRNDSVQHSGASHS
nr:alpha/beta fold hydrolase [uncultured Lichenicoccus sp.]